MGTTSEPKSRRAEYADATREALLLAGRENFVREGFQAAAIDAISRDARVTRGAFYHHFEDKRALFDAVVVSLQREAASKIAERARKEERVWNRLSAGIDAYLDVCLEREYGRIVISEGAAVLGNARHQEIEEAHPVALLSATLAALKRNGELECDNVAMLTKMIDAMIAKLALALPDATDPAAERAAGLGIIARLLECYRREP